MPEDSESHAQFIAAFNKGSAKKQLRFLLRLMFQLTIEMRGFENNEGGILAFRQIGQLLHQILPYAELNTASAPAARRADTLAKMIVATLVKLNLMGALKRAVESSKL